LKEVENYEVDNFKTGCEWKYIQNSSRELCDQFNALSDYF